MTEFEEKIYKVVAKIPTGETATYKQIAVAAGYPKAYRAVGNALNKNPFPSEKVPCHRVVRSDRRIGGYLLGKKEKIKLLKMEMGGKIGKLKL